MAEHEEAAEEAAAEQEALENAAALANAGQGGSSADFQALDAGEPQEPELSPKLQRIQMFDGTSKKLMNNLPLGATY